LLWQCFAWRHEASASGEWLCSDAQINFMRALTAQREAYRLTAEEREAFRSLRGWPPESAFMFWKDIASSRARDYRTIIGVEGDPLTFTALPVGHRKHWCWPMPLKCMKPASAFRHVESAD
jgi:hypothetical protein